MKKKNKKTTVTLRKKTITKGKRLSLYLDYYPALYNPVTKKFSRREFLNLYLIVRPSTPFDKIVNEENLNTAKMIQVRRQNELLKEDIYTEFEKGLLQIKEIGKMSFMDYFQKQADKKVGSNYDIWEYAMGYFKDFINTQDITFSEITVALVEDFRDYMLQAKSKRMPDRKLANNSAQSYFNKLKATLKQAFKEGLLQQDINGQVEYIKELETQRNFLYLEEAQRLFNTECPKEMVKSAALFSILTGMRYSDIEKLEWLEIEYSEYDGPLIRFRQQKTDGQQTLPISNHAFELLGGRKNPHSKVFEGLKKWDVDRFVPIWVAAAGITKHITFHCFRHTYATLQLNSGTDIFTVSKLLGHRSVRTTQIYTKVIDKTKRESTGRINLR